MERPIEHPAFDALWFWAGTDPRCLGPMTQAVIVETLGLETETDDVKFGSTFTFTDRRGNKVRCARNLHNRPLDWPQVENLCQIHLNRQWAGPECFPGKSVNGETIVIDAYGDIQQGQHTLIGAYLAEQDRTETDESGELTESAKHWQTKWPGEVTLDKLVVVGVSPDDEIINTIDTGRPRSLSDVLFRSEVFAAKGPNDRKTLAKMMEHSIRLIWQRTGMRENAWAPIQNHTESMAFLARHPKLRDAVIHVFDENGKKKIATIDDEGKDASKTVARIGQYVPPGIAAGLLYLMAASDADGDKYRNADEKTEKRAGITKANWDKAKTFWAYVGDNPDFQEVRYGLAYTADSSTGLGGTLPEKIDVMVRAWNEYRRDDFTAFGEGKCFPHYATDADNTRYLTDRPTLGGIDLAPGVVSATAAAEVQPDAPAEDPTVAEMATTEAAKTTARKKKAAPPAPEPAPVVSAEPIDLAEALTTLRKDNPGVLILFTAGGMGGTVRAYGADHKHLTDLQLGYVTKGRAGALRYAEFPAANLQDVLDLLTDPKLELKVGVSRIGPDGQPGAVEVQ